MGGTGSFGQAITQKLLDSGASEVRVFSRDEKKQEDLRVKFPSDKLTCVIGDVREPRSVLSAIDGVDCVFHAAALKQVPSCERYPFEAVKTNILGTQNVIDACIQAETPTMVALSTDKAVYPVNAMGQTKAVMEKLVSAASHRSGKAQKFVTTRYGNVIASRGSVIPHFIRQLKSSDKVTITDPSMTRFLMSLEEAANLVLYAMTEGEDGDLFVQKSPAATVDTVADAVASLLGKQLSSSQKVIVGARAGEKAHEVLVGSEELLTAVSLGSYYRIPAHSETSIRSNLSSLLPYSSQSTKRLSVSETVEILKGNAQVAKLL